MTKGWKYVILAAALIVLSACAKQTNQPMNGMDHGSHGDHGAGGQTAASVTTKAAWTYSAANPKAGTKTAVSIAIQDAGGKPVEQFDINHEKKMHLIIVSKDLAYFDHIHPEYKGNGKFDIETQFPAGGDYKLIADYVPTGGTATTQSNWLKVEGTAPSQTAITADQTLTRTVDGKEVTLTPERLSAGQDVKLTFRITDAATKKPVTDLQPYLGAVGHVVILSADAGQYLHVHPMDEKAKGPDAVFMTNFPKSGLYKVWGQFQQNGKTFIVPFTVQVS